MSAQVLHYSGTRQLFEDLTFTISRKTAKFLKFGALENNQLYGMFTGRHHRFPHPGGPAFSEQFLSGMFEIQYFGSL